jgi:uncharacterized coiled-coil DUF342 family protein
MVNKRIEHPLRTIEITYDEMKPFHPFEEEMLDRYTRLHNYVKELHEEYTSVQKKYEMHDSNIRRVIARYKAIKGRMSNMHTTAKKALGLMVPDKNEAQQIVNEASQLKELMELFHKEVAKLAHESDTLGRIFTPLDSKDERMSELFAEYKEIRKELGEGDEDYSLDMEQYDMDEQAFMHSLTNMAGKQEEFINVCNQVIDRYNMLIEEVERTYEEWSKYNELIEMMRLLILAPYDLTSVCLN